MGGTLRGRDACGWGALVAAFRASFRKYGRDISFGVPVDGRVADPSQVVQAAQEAHDTARLYIALTFSAAIIQCVVSAVTVWWSAWTTRKTGTDRQEFEHQKALSEETRKLLMQIAERFTAADEKYVFELPHEILEAGRKPLPPGETANALQDLYDRNMRAMAKSFASPLALCRLLGLTEAADRVREFAREGGALIDICHQESFERLNGVADTGMEEKRDGQIRKTNEIRRAFFELLAAAFTRLPK